MVKRECIFSKHFFHCESCENVLISGPIPTLWRGTESVSRLLALPRLSDTISTSFRTVMPVGRHYWLQTARCQPWQAVGLSYQNWNGQLSAKASTHTGRHTESVPTSTDPLLSEDVSVPVRDRTTTFLLCTLFSTITNQGVSKSCHTKGKVCWFIQDAPNVKTIISSHCVDSFSLVECFNLDCSHMSPFSVHVQIKGKSQMLVGGGGFLVQCEGGIYF